MDRWQNNFLEKLNQAQSKWVTSFEETLNRAVTPAFKRVSTFVSDNGFRVTSPLKEDGRRSFKFELAENAYLLLIFRFGGIGELEVRTESFVPGREPSLNRSPVRLVDVDEEWATRQFQQSLDIFVDLLAGAKAADAANAEELLAV
ncbi:MAG: hypothetical protein KDA32_07610 [Phycisphaerales bacterium]|nr:hypothetical protein [Phycisphaerales bacterium]